MRDGRAFHREQAGCCGLGLGGRGVCPFSTSCTKETSWFGLRVNVNRQIRGPKNSTMQTTLIDLLSRCIVHLVVSRLAERVRQPFESFVETITGCGASRLNVL